MGTIILAVVVVFVVLLVLALKLYPRRLTIFEYERGVKYFRGKFHGLLQAGQYWYFPFYSTIEKVDIRPCYMAIKGQEILSSDSITLKISLAAQYEVVDPISAINKTQDYHDAFYTELQLALREIIGTATIDTILEKRQEFAARLMESTTLKIEALGLHLISVNIKDIMFPGELKQIFAQEVKARKAGLAALEKARGETAALRNLANAAKMLESNPNLMQLRLLHALGESSGHTIVLNMSPPQILSVTSQTDNTGSADTSETSQDAEKPETAPKKKRSRRSRKKPTAAGPKNDEATTSEAL